MATAAKPSLDTTCFFQQLASADKRFLILDFDTTIAKLPSNPSRYLYAHVPDLLECIAASGRTRLILASSASPAELLPSLVCPDFEIWACDGRQRIVPVTPGNSAERVPMQVRGSRDEGRRGLIQKRSCRYPVAYLVGAGIDSDELFVTPELHFSKTQVLTGAPEPLVQFLADWLRACAGEVC